MFSFFFLEYVKNRSFKYFGTNTIHYMVHILGIQGKSITFVNNL